MRSDLSIKYLLIQATQSAVRQAFYKRKFKDDFNEKETTKINRTLLFNDISITACYIINPTFLLTFERVLNASLAAFSAPLL